MNIQEYFEEIKNKVAVEFELAGRAKAIGIDPVARVEIPIATTLAEKAVGLISVVYPQLDRKVIDRIEELEKEYGALDSAVAFKIAEEIAREKFCKFESLMQGIDAGIRVGFSYITLGVVSSPIEGFTEVKLGKTKEGKDYFIAYFSGPIRSAGTTASCMVLMLIDYLRETFGFAKYDPDENEVKRYITENYDYHERVNNLQYLPSEEEIEFLARNLPIQIDGEKTADREVSNYKDLPRMHTSFIRGGMCLIFSEGLAQKAQKGLRLWKGVQDKGFKCTGWEFLEEYVKRFKQAKKEGSNSGSKPTYIKDLVAGRPVFSHPSRSGGFRFRYGRSRTSGFSAVSVHPATMTISGNFMSAGTQLKVEKPTKGCVISSCDDIDGPIVKLKDGSVMRVTDAQEGKKIYNNVDEIIYFGDILFSYGDVINRNYDLLKPGYVPEWWELELRKAEKDSNEKRRENFDKFKISFDEAVELSNKFKIPLHPNYIYYWHEIEYDKFLALVDWISHGDERDGKLVLPFTKDDRERFSKGKRALELIGCEHRVTLENVVLNEIETKAFLFNLGIDDKIFKEEIEKLNVKIKELGEKEALDIVNSLCENKIKDKSGTFIGARMGRPEKAKLRKLVGSPHVLFPVGAEGGRLRSLQSAVEAGSVRSDFPNFYCEKCNKGSVYLKCVQCGENCNKVTEEGREYSSRRVEIREYYDKAKKLVGLRDEEMPIIKGVRGTINKDHSCEHLGKGLLRAKYGLNVNKDGTIRYDMTEMIITHFRPREIGTSVEKLMKLGYEKDIYGKELENEEQILCLFPHDLILPACPETLDEKADDVVFKITNFIDDELDKLYSVERFFNAKKKEDVLGTLVVCIAPHICTATVGRIIGFSKTQGFLASPYMHAAMRRDCLGHDNYVSIKENGNWKIVKIGEYIEKERPEKQIDMYGTLAKKVNNISTWSNPGEDEVVEVTKHTPTKMLKLYLEDGRNIELTKDHRVYVKGKKEMRASELKEGDQLMISYKRNIEEKDIGEIFLPEIFKDRDDVMLRNVRDYLSGFEKISQYENFSFRDSFPIKIVANILEKNGKSFRDLPSSTKIAIKRDNVNLPIRIKLDKELLEMIGLYISEGHCRKNDSKKGLYQISIAGKEVKEFVKKVFLSYFELKPTHEREDAVTFSSRIIYELFINYLGCGKGAHGKRIPSIFLDLKKEKIAALLRGYYEGDGSVSLSDYRVTCDSVSEGLKHDLSFVLSRFGIYTKFYEYEKEPGPQVKEFYIRKKRTIPKFRITKISILSNFIKTFNEEIGFLSERKNKILNKLCQTIERALGMRIEYDTSYVYPKIKKIEIADEKISYCFNVASEHNFFANDILVHNCDGDECAIMLLMDLLLNFSRSFLPAHRGGTQDAPLVLNTAIRAGDVDDQILDFELGEYPLELYEMAEQKKHSSECKTIETVKMRLKKGEDVFSNIHFTHNCFDINAGVLNSSYKILPTMDEKVNKQMELCGKLRAVDLSDVARLTIERHFIRDTKGNLRKFSMQVFRCVQCNEKYRRPPLMGKCGKCGGRLIFTISEGSVLKYMQKALELARDFEVSPYLLENLELTEMYIHSIFGKEKEKQENISKWF
ncbi:MAG: DNA polymerase II large subunit [Nanoarchaeota archaeon]|nr:DNA polymerase II large subunit [Nanoarchaeota archaeon]